MRKRRSLAVDTSNACSIGALDHELRFRRRSLAADTGNACSIGALDHELRFRPRGAAIDSSVKRKVLLATHSQESLPEAAPDLAPKLARAGEAAIRATFTAVTVVPTTAKSRRDYHLEVLITACLTLHMASNSLLS